MLEMIRGDTAKFKFRRIDVNGNPIIIPAQKIFFTVKQNYHSSAFIFQKDLDHMNFDIDGYYHIVIDPEDTDGLPYNDYVYDIEVVTEGYKQTISRGIFRILPEVTFVENEG